MKWKWIEGYENLYKICKNSDVISYKKYEEGKILKPYINSRGYLSVGLCKNKKQKKFRIHRLIAIHFIENPNNYQIVDHINGNKTDNRIQNLRWITQSGNMRNSKNWGEYLKGVSFNKKINKFRAQIYIDNKHKHLGYFETELEAYEKYMEKNNELMKEFEKIKI